MNPTTLAHLKTAAVAVVTAALVAGLDVTIDALGSAGLDAFDAPHLRAALGVAVGAAVVAVRAYIAANPYHVPAPPVAPPLPPAPRALRPVDRRPDEDTRDAA